MIVEGLVPDARRPGSTRVVVGGRPAWTVPADVVAELALVAGGPLTGAQMERLDRAADEEGAFRSGLRSLERRAHARQELQRKLERKGHTADAVASAIVRLERLGLLDDVAFAQQYVASRSARGRGPVRLRYDLRSLGIADDTIAHSVASIPTDHDDPLAQPRALAIKRAGQLGGLPRETRRRRLSAFLARRGFNGSDARAVIDHVLGGMQHDE
ncbi:MAG: regulatory protein RecX [Gemmatimonadales bacterium]|nr:regulatory protein RecX [Gemmatimonadales bacterium]